MFYTQINISCKKCNIVAILTFTQFTPVYMPKNLENAPAQVLTQSHHCRCTICIKYNQEQYVER